MEDELQALRSEYGRLKARIHELGREKQLLLNEVKGLRELVGEEPGIIKINVNGVDQWIKEGEVSYDDCANLAGINPEWLPTIVCKGTQGKSTLIPSQSLTLEEGMRLTVVVTGAA